MNLTSYNVILISKQENIMSTEAFISQRAEYAEPLLWSLMTNELYSQSPDNRKSRLKFYSLSIKGYCNTLESICPVLHCTDLYCIEQR